MRRPTQKPGRVADGKGVLAVATAGAGAGAITAAEVVEVVAGAGGGTKPVGYRRSNAHYEEAAPKSAAFLLARLGCTVCREHHGLKTEPHLISGVQRN